MDEEIQYYSNLLKEAIEELKKSSFKNLLNNSLIFDIITDLGYNINSNSSSSYDEKNLETINILDLNFFELNNILILYFDKKMINDIVHDFTEFVKNFHDRKTDGKMFHINKYII
jgi:hypothetical protein